MGKIVYLHLHGGGIETMEVSDALGQRIAEALARGDGAFRGVDDSGQAVRIDFTKYAAVNVRNAYAGPSVIPD